MAIIAIFPPAGWSQTVPDPSLPGPDPVSAECLACHDEMTPPEDGTQATQHHSVGINYSAQQGQSPTLRPTVDLPAELILTEGKMTCATCHGLEPHDGEPLVIDNRGSALCSACHRK